MAKEFGWCDPENTLTRIQFHVELVKPIEDLLEMHPMIFFPLSLDDNIVYINFNCDAYKILEDVINQPLICSTYIFETKGHNFVTILAIFSNECLFLLIFFANFIRLYLE